MLTNGATLDVSDGASEFLIASASDSFATDGFTADAQLFERAAAVSRPKGSGAGGWTYTGAATVSLRRAAHRTATLRVQVHGAASAELSVLRPSQARRAACSPSA